MSCKLDQQLSERLGVGPEAFIDVILRHDIAEIAVFGSVLRDDFGPASDVDLLVSFLPEKRLGPFELMDIEDAFAEMFGRPVEVVSKRWLTAHWREAILQSERVIYAGSR